VSARKPHGNGVAAAASWRHCRWKGRDRGNTSGCPKICRALRTRREVERLRQLLPKQESWRLLFVRGGKRALAQIAHNSILKFADEGERLRRAERQKLVEFAFTAREAASREAISARILRARAGDRERRFFRPLKLKSSGLPSF